MRVAQQITSREFQDPRFPQVSRAFLKMMSGEPLTREEIEEADRLGYEELKVTEEEDKRLAFLSDPNKSKYMTPAEKRYEISKIMGRRRGGPVLTLAGGMNVSAGGGSARSSRGSKAASPKQMKQLEELAWNMPSSNFRNYA
jgi:hypothetical protein